MLSILYYIFTVIHTTVWCIISALVLAVTYPFDKSRRLVHECSRYMTWVFSGFRRVCAAPSTAWRRLRRPVLWRTICGE